MFASFTKIRNDDTIAVYEVETGDGETHIVEISIQEETFRVQGGSKPSLYLGNFMAKFLYSGDNLKILPEKHFIAIG